MPLRVGLRSSVLREVRLLEPDAGRPRPDWGRPRPPRASGRPRPPVPRASGRPPERPRSSGRPRPAPVRALGPPLALDPRDSGRPLPLPAPLRSGLPVGRPLPRLGARIGGRPEDRAGLPCSSRRGLRGGSSTTCPVVGGRNATGGVAAHDAAKPPLRGESERKDRRPATEIPRHPPRSERDDARLNGRASSSKEPAASYSPRGSTPKYHRRGRA